MKPLEGVKVADFTWAQVGPYSTKYLADFGATVVKIGSSTHPDAMRTFAPFKDNIPGINRSATFATYNTSKYQITINMRHPKAVEIAKRIILWADVVVESFAGGIMKDRWGLGYEDIKKIKPDIIMLSSCTYGQTGPFQRVASDGLRLTALAGITNITGWPDRTPAGPFQAYTDSICPHFNALAIVAALDYRRRTGKGQYIDASQYEESLHFVGPLILDYTVNKRINKAMGNHCEYAAPYGVYQCQGNDRWCAISIFTDEEWDSFCRVIGNPEWTRDPRFGTLASRIKNADELDKLVESWTKERQAEEIMKLMQAADIAAGVAQNGKDLDNDPQLKHYHYYQEIDHPEMGKFPYKKLPIELSKTPGEVRRSPCLGEHNHFIYTEVFGMPEEEFQQLSEEGVFD